VATYVIPQVLVFQDFQASPQAQANPLQAHISGPNAQLIRFAQSSEMAQGLVGVYDPLDDDVVDWPNRPAGGVVDESYTKLFIQNAILRYFDSGTSGVTDIVKTAGFNNRVYSPSFNFAANGTYSRDDALLDRDVQLGDLVKLRWSTESGAVTQWSYVNGLLPDPVAASISTSLADTGNQATNVTASATAVQTRGPFNAIHIIAASAASYDPFPTGKVNEKYTVVVTTGSVNGDLTTATLRVISASGLDDQAAVTPSARGVATNIGTHGVTVTFDRDTQHAGRETDSESADDQGVSPDDLISGQRFDVTVVAAFTAPVSRANDTASHASTPYTGGTDTTYVITVSNGGQYANGGAQITVTTTTGVDVSGPTNVTTVSTPVAVGNFGVTVQFTGAGLALGDRYYIPVSAKGNGRIGTIVLGHNIPATVADGDGAELQLFIKKASLEIDQNRVGYAPLTNFDMTETQLTIHSGIVAYDPTWTADGVPQALPLDSDAGQNYSVVYVQTRYWIQDLTMQVNSINDVGDINTAIPGALDVDNPLKWGVFQALTNANGNDVTYTAVAGDPADASNWADVLGVITGRDDVYGLVPLTTQGTVLELFAAHVDDQSSSNNDLWRVAWFNLTGMPEIPIVSAGSTVPGYLQPTTTDGNAALATISDDPESTGTQYTIVSVPGGNAQFLVNGVRPGDIVRTFYTTDGFGNTTYQEFVIDIVQSEDQLRLLAGPTIAVTYAARIEIWRNLNATDEAAAIAKNAGSYGNRRIRAVWPDTIGSGGTLMAGYHLCAALAGLSSGIVPQQGMTNLAITGFDDLTRTTRKFNSDQLNTMAGSGVWIVTQNPTGTVYTRHAVTTGLYTDINQREEMITRNVDSISFLFKDAFAPYIGVCNVTPSMQLLLESVVDTLISQLSVSTVATLGPQMIDATIVSLRPSLTLADRYVLILDIDVPAPFNNFEIHLVV
jgi:hypothetical protein